MLGERESGTARFEEAVIIFREALIERIRGRAPLIWAMIQNNLGNALVRLGDRESSMARLVEAVTAYREALRERTRERVPLLWAATHNGLGVWLESLGERESDTARLEKALVAYREAVEVFEVAHIDYYAAITNRNIERVQSLITKRKSENPK